MELGYLFLEGEGSTNLYVKYFLSSSRMLSSFSVGVFDAATETVGFSLHGPKEGEKLPSYYDLFVPFPPFLFS